MEGDSGSSEDIAKLMDGKMADLLITDPPYGVNYESKVASLKTDDKYGKLRGNRSEKYTKISNDELT